MNNNINCEIFLKELVEMEKLKYHNIFDTIPWYQYCNEIVGLTVGAFTKYLHNVSNE